MAESPSDPPTLLDRPSSDTSTLYGDHSGTYALQIALRSMKDRYQKLQKKVSLIEEENKRLIHGKSELFGEIGRMQENSIRLREKNLQLNQEIHSRHQECCTLREKFSQISRDNMTLMRQLARATQDNKKLFHRINLLNAENQNLRDRIILVREEIKKLPEDVNITSLDISLSSIQSKISVLSSKTSENLDIINNPLDEFECISTTLDDTEIVSKIDGEDEPNVVDSLNLINKSTERVKCILQQLKEQRHCLLVISPFVHSVSYPADSYDSNHGDEDAFRNIGTQNACFPTSQEIENMDDSPERYASRLATQGSSVAAPFMLSVNESGMNTLTSEISEETNVFVQRQCDKSASPFDWKKVKVSDNEDNSHSKPAQPSTRNVSTSPVDLFSEDDRTCPMCHALFPKIVPQETFEEHVISHFENESGFEVV